jgi:hypothetical protein
VSSCSIGSPKEHSSLNLYLMEGTSTIIAQPLSLSPLLNTIMRKDMLEEEFYLVRLRRLIENLEDFVLGIPLECLCIRGITFPMDINLSIYMEHNKKVLVVMRLRKEENIERV